MELQREEKRSLKQGLRLPRTPHRSKTRYLVSVWIDRDKDWLDDMKFRFVEDANVHAARWNRLYGVTLTRVLEVEV
jgi:hypothetical protein